MHLWSVIALAAVVVFLVGLVLRNGGAQAVACIASVLVSLVACVRALDTESYRNRERGYTVSARTGPTLLA